MSNVFIDFAGIFHVKDDLFRFIDTMEDHQKVLIFTINSENDFKNVRHILYPLPFCYLLHFNMYIDIIKY